ncbi:MAG: hypothetical protein Q7V63_03545 [Gammaproteobacteria bacterium]|nr:hypothetical protein [Gammaproteobacteria bacterium]
MRLLKKSIIAIAVSSAVIAGLAYANTPYANPFIDTTQSNAAPTTPATPAASTTTPVATNPPYNFTKRPTGIISQAPPLIPNSAPATNSTYTTAPPTIYNPNPAPNLGPGGTQQAGSGSLIKAIQNLDTDVKDTNKLSVAQWNQTIQNQALANAMLLPTNLNFIWGQSAYQIMQQLVPSSINQASVIQNTLNPSSLSGCSTGSKLGTCQGSIMTTNSALALLTPQPLSQTNPSALGGTQLQQTLNGNNYINALIGSSLNTANQNHNTYQMNIISAAQSVLTTIAVSNSPDQKDGLDSQMALLNAAVTAPLSNIPDPATNQTWFQQLSVASTPQVLRSVAVMLALNNYLQYQNLKAAQNQQMLQATQLIQEVKLEQAINTLDSNEAARQYNALARIAVMLQKVN